jgi:hypothetical protein
MANEDVLLTAALDPTAVERALGKIEQRVDQMVAHSNKRMQLMGQATQSVATITRGLLKEFTGLDTAGMNVDQRKQFITLQKNILKSVDALDGLIVLMRDLEEIKIGDGPTTSKRFMIRESLEKEIAAISGDLLVEVIMDRAGGRVSTRAKMLRNDLVALMEDPTISGKELRQQINLIEGELKELGEAAFAAQSVAGQPRALERDSRVRDLAGLEGGDLRDRLDRDLKRMGQGVTDFEKRVADSASRIREDLVKAMADPAKSGQQLREEVRKLENEYEDLVAQAREMQQVSAQGGGLSLGGRQDTMARETSRIIGDIQTDQLRDQLAQMMQSSEDVVREGAVRIRARLEGMLDAPPEGDELVQQLSVLQREANKIAGVKPIDLVKEDEAAQIRDMEASLARFAQLTEEASGKVTRSAIENIGQERRRAQAYADAARAGVISYKEADEAIKRSTTSVRNQVGAYTDAARAVDILGEAQARVFADIEADALAQQVGRLMQSSETRVAEGALIIEQQLAKAFAEPANSEQLLARVRELQTEANKLDKVKPIDLVEADEAAQMRAMQASLAQFNQIADETSKTVTASARENIALERERAQAYADAGRSGRASYAVANAAIKQSTANVRAQGAAYEELTQEVDEFARERARIFANVEGVQLTQQIRRMMDSSQEVVREGASNIRRNLAEAFRDRESTEGFLEIVRELKREADKLDSLQPPELIDAEEVAEANRLLTRMQELDQVVAEVNDTATDEAQERIAAEVRFAQAAKDSADTYDQSYKKANQSVGQAITNVKRHANVLREATAETDDLAESTRAVAQAASEFEGIDKKLTRKESLNAYKASMQDLNAIMGSNEAEARELALELQKIGREAKRSFDAGESSAEDFADSMDKLERSTKRLAGAYDVDVPSGANRASISLWKLGNVADRVGLRGAGGATQLVDALRGIPIAAVAAVVAVAAVAAAVFKVAQALVEMGKRAAKAFGEFVKGASEAAKSVEVTDNQLGGFLRAPDLGRAYRKLLQETSFDVGLDLTQDFSRVLVPLAKDVDEVERAAKIAGTLAHAFQETEDAITNAIKQAAGGHFRPLIERFGLTEFEIETIRRAQEEYGEFTGVLEGLQSALDFRGLNIETLSGTLQFIQGQMQVVRKQIEVTLGEPVNEALSEQFTRLFDIVEDRKGPLLNFFESLGDTIGGVIEAIGSVLTGFADDISDDDIIDFETAIANLGGQIEEAVEALGRLFSTEDRSIVDVAIDLTNALSDVAEKLEEILTIFDGIKKVQDTINFELPGGTGARLFDLIKPDPGIGQPSGFLSAAIGEAGDLFTMISTGEAPDPGERLLRIGRAIPVIGQAINALEVFGVIGGEAEDAADGLAGAHDRVGDAADGQADKTRELINEQQELSAQLRDLEQLQLAAADAQKKITEAEGKLQRQRSMREGEIRTRFDRQDIDAEIKRSEKREDLFEKHMQRMLQLTDDLNQKRADAELDFDRKGLDAETKYQDKLEDIAQDTTDKKIDIERKFQDRLKDIRAKFDLDAEEAIRRNDAVSLLRIRRRMKLEIETAQRNRQRQIDEAEEVDEKKRDNAKKWLDRQERDLDIAEQRKLDDLEKADERRRQQLIDQYIWEYAQIDKQYERQKAAREVNLKRAIDDMNAQFDVREAEMTKSLSAEYDIVKEWKDKETDYMKIKLQEQANLVQQQYALWAQEGSLFSQFMTGNTLHPSNFNPLNPTGPTGVSGRFGPDYLEDDPNLQGIGTGRQHGGYVTAGNVYGVNERGPEAFYATRAGIIASRDSFNLPSSMPGGATNIDNSRTIQTGDILAMDPNKMSPIDRTLMAHRFTEQMLAYGL